MNVSNIERVSKQCFLLAEQQQQKIGPKEDCYLLQKFEYHNNVCWLAMECNTHPMCT